MDDLVMRVARFRARHNMTLRMFAEHAGIAANSLARFERLGPERVTRIMIGKIMEALEKEPEVSREKWMARKENIQ